MQKTFKRNVGWIFIGNVAHAVLQYLLNIYIARVFSTDDYGLINYAASLIAFFTSVGTLGFSGIIIKSFSEDEKNTGKYLGSAIGARLMFSVGAIVLLQVIVRTANSEDAMLPTIVFYQSISILFGAFDLIVYWFRYKYEAQRVAVLKLAAFFVSAAWRIVVVAVFRSLTGYVFGVTLETVVFSILLAVSFRKNYPEHRFRFSARTVRDLLLISYPFITSEILSTIYGQTDKIMLKSMMNNEAVAMYSVALTLASAISIIPQALIEGFRPDILKYRATDSDQYHRRLKQLYASVFWICIAYCIAITVLAKWIILILYGEKYLGAVPALSLVVWYTTFSYFGSINNIYMVAENKAKWVQITTLVGALTNVCLNFLLIPRFGIVGAAGASLLTQFIANFIMVYLIKPLREDFFLILQAIRLDFK